MGTSPFKQTDKAIITPAKTRTGYEFLIPTLQLPDVDDCHVLAAAIRSQSSVIITFNLKDFPAKELAKYDVEALHPNKFSE